MRLSEVIWNQKGRLIRDGEFISLNYCTADVEIPFLSFLENIKYAEKINEKVSCILCKPGMESSIPDYVEGIFITEEPKVVFQRIHNSLRNHPEYALPEFETFVGENCSFGEYVCISEKNVRIGNDVTIEDFVTIYPHTTIGNHCVIHSGAIIGGNGFTFARNAGGELEQIEDLGQTILEDGVEIFPNTHIARGILPSDITLIGRGTKIDAMGYIGHGTCIGENTLIAGGASIAGNVVIGKDVWVGINATISNRIHVGDGAHVSLGAVVTKNVEKGQTVSGNFAIDHQKFLGHLREVR